MSNEHEYVDLETKIINTVKIKKETWIYVFIRTVYTYQSVFDSDIDDIYSKSCSTPKIYNSLRNQHLCSIWS